MSGIFLSVLLAFAGGSEASAETQVQTRAGLAQVTGAYTEKSVTIGGVSLPLPEGLAYIDIEEQLGDLLLLSLSYGGNACPAEYVWVHAVPGAIRLSDTFGTCSDLYELSYDSETVSVSMPSMRSGDNHNVTFVYDGKTIREEAGSRKEQGVATVAGWQGQHISMVIGDAGWEGYFLSFMPPEALADARRILNVGHNMEWQGPWLTAWACQPHACNSTRGAIAMTADGTGVIVALWEGATGVRLWGNPKGLPLPGTVLDVVAQQN
ncbi:hypothetical protein HCZ23_14370 [Celeribacter sp. HF31]|uniref:hypothetical protein n=1 Tax=Celeribacter sp. HF31 TaxID=2721558 RepID=UPI00142F7050|nr:hypothetical protein [Celeribacter sp. HF31]NIY80647.1 hypothetical protein [Celeribacter sp. HF31]